MATIENLIAVACQVNDCVSQAMRPTIIAQGLTPASFDLLSAIWAADGRESQADIGKRLGLSRATISEAITSLVSAGYVVRKPSESDSRAVTLELTAAGHKKVKAILQEMKQIEQEISSKLSNKEAETALKILKKLISAIKIQIS